MFENMLQGPENPDDEPYPKLAIFLGLIVLFTALAIMLLFIIAK